MRIDDRPALRWRILSDDVSRGPLPTMRYFEERIRTIAAFKMNGYSPYMEHVFVSPTDPLPAPLDGITPAQLRASRCLRRAISRDVDSRAADLRPYAQHAQGRTLRRRGRVAARVSSGAQRSALERISRAHYHARARCGGRTPFFHIGSDETATLGLGRNARRTSTQRGRSQAYADHVVAMNRLIAPSGARIMLWDDGIENDPKIMKLIPKNAVIVNWHYGDETTFEPYIQTIARGGFEQMVAPGASNWNEIFPNVNRAIANERASSTRAKRRAFSGSFKRFGTTMAKRSTKRRGIR